MGILIGYKIHITVYKKNNNKNINRNFECKKPRILVV